MRYRQGYATLNYDRQKGVLRKEDYVFMRECLEKHLENMQLSSHDCSNEIDKLKMLFIKLDHAISRL